MPSFEIFNFFFQSETQKFRSLFWYFLSIMNIIKNLKTRYTLLQSRSWIRLTTLQNFREKHKQRNLDYLKIYFTVDVVV